MHSKHLIPRLQSGVPGDDVEWRGSRGEGGGTAVETPQGPHWEAAPALLVHRQSIAQTLALEGP